MKNLRNIKKAPFEIGQLLATNTEICALLLDDSNTPTSNSVTFKELLDNKYIVLYPPIDSGEIQDYTRNTFLVILIDNISPSADENTLVNGTIYISTDEGHLLLSNNRNRLLELADKILQTLDGAKLTAAGEVHINAVSHIMITNFRAGYRISFTFTDQPTRKAEI